MTRNEIAERVLEWGFQNETPVHFMGWATGLNLDDGSTWTRGVFMLGVSNTNDEPGVLLFNWEKKQWEWGDEAAPFDGLDQLLAIGDF